MSNDPGKIYKGATEYYVNCIDCGKEVAVMLYTKAEAITELVWMNWKRKKGLWVCPDCSRFEGEGVA